MKNLSFLATLVLGVTLASTAHAIIPVNGPFSNLFQPNDVTTFKLTDYENVFDSAGNLVTGTIVQGDTFQGIYIVTNSQNSGAGNQLGPLNFQVAGIFDTLVLSTTSGVGPGGTNTAFTLGVDPNFNAHFGLTGTNALPAGAMTALYQGPANQFNASTGSISAANIAAAVGSVLNGATLAQVAGNANGANQTGNNSTWYWAAVGPAGPGVASFAASLNLLYSNPLIAPALGGLASNLTQQAPANYDTQTIIDALSAIQNKVALQGNTSLQTLGNIPFEIGSQDPLREQNLAPEPTGILVVGGLFGLWGFAKVVARRRKSAA